VTVTRTRVIVGAAIIGLVVLTVVLAYESLNQTGVARIVGYQHFSDERGLVVIVELGAADELAERQVEEKADSVKVTVHVRRPTGAVVPLYLIVVPVPVSLHQVLGDRRVLAQDGTPVQDLGVYQKPSPAPRP
jgi:hypothetical protein